MGYLENSELNKLKNDMRTSKIALDADKEIFAVKLLNGMGEDMRNELRSPTKPNKMLGFRIKFTRWWYGFKEKWNNLKVSEK